MYIDFRQDQSCSTLVHLKVFPSWHLTPLIAVVTGGENMSSVCKRDNVNKPQGQYSFVE